VSYKPVVAAALSGASLGQLSYWRSPRSSEAPLLAPAFHVPRARVAYSYRDVVVLRTFVYLRSQGVPLQRVRRAVRSLRELGELDHLSSYRFVAVGRDVVWLVSDKLAVDLTRQPGQQVIAEMVDILAEFRGPREHSVVALHSPAPGLEIDPGVRGGYPVIVGTRVPYDVVASLLDDGVSAEDVVHFYPSVSPAAALGAVTLARYIDGYRAKLPA
jgi:uncharacterized protein (DUF433 family)